MYDAMACRDAYSPAISVDRCGVVGECGELGRLCLDLVLALARSGTRS